MVNVILYVATSLDGYIAREDGGIDWLSEDEKIQSDYGYQSLYNSIKSIIMGGRTYDQIKGFGGWPYQEKQCFVFTRNQNRKSDDNVVFISDPISFTKELINKNEGDIWLVGGSEIIKLLMDKGLINDIIITILPIILGRGIPLFKSIKGDINLDLVESKSFKTGFVQSHYKIQG